MSREVRLSRRDETLVDLLIETGLSRNIAKTLVFLSKRAETTSVEIEKATGLRQPEVSIAMQELRRRKWVDKRDIKKEGFNVPAGADITDKSKRWKLEQLEAALEYEQANANRKGAIAALESAIAAKQEKEG